MRVVGKYANHGEAAVAQSLLEQEGIASETSDGGWVGMGVPEVSVLVEANDLLRAVQILDEMRKEAAPAPVTTKEPAAFPYLGVAGFFALLYALVRGAMVFAYSASDVKLSVWDCFVWAAATAAGSLIPGLLAGLFFAALAAGAVRMWRGLSGK